MRSARDTQRLFVVIGSLQVGGSEQHLARVLPRLVELGWRVTLYTLTGDGPLRPGIERRGVDVRFLPFFDALPVGRNVLLRGLRLACVAVHLAWTMRACRPRIAHFFLPEAYVMGAACALATGVPSRIMSRRSLNRYQRTRPLMRRVERWLHRRMSLIAGNSRAVLRELEAEGVPNDRLRLTYNGIELPAPGDDAVRAATRASAAIAPDALVVISVANLIPYKGHLDLLDALAGVAGSMPPDWRLVCVGRDLGYGETLRRRARELGIADKVRFLGERNDVGDLLAMADIFVLASHQEGFSNALLEAMGAGLPTVATDVGGNGEAVVDGETGLIVPARDPAALGAAIRRLAGDSRLRHAMGRAGRSRIARHFTLQAAVEQYQEMYRQAMGADPAALGDGDSARPADATVHRAITLAAETELAGHRPQRDGHDRSEGGRG